MDLQSNCWANFKIGAKPVNFRSQAVPGAETTLSGGVHLPPALFKAWAGHPGTLVKSYPGTGPGVPLTVDQAPCDGRPESLGWAIANGQLRAPPAAAAAVIAGAQCLGTASGPAGQTTQQESILWLGPDFRGVSRRLPHFLAAVPHGGILFRVHVCAVR